MNQAKRQTKRQSIVVIISDGLDQSYPARKGRGWGAKHQAAADLANAAPEMLGLIKDLYDIMCGIYVGRHLPAARKRADARIFKKTTAMLHRLSWAKNQING